MAREARIGIDEHVVRLEKTLREADLRRIVRAYKGDDPVASMEMEVSTLLLGVIHNAASATDSEGVSGIQRGEDD